MNYWRTRIRGTLTLQSPLALGDGGYERPEKKDEDNDGGGVDTVQKTRNLRAVIPGSSLKGVLRAWLESRGIDPEGLVGRAARPKRAGQKTRDLGRGGKVEFGFCYSQSPIDFTSSACREQSVAVDRVTRAAAERLLFARQVVPAGTVFDVELLGFDIRPQELSALLAALEGFNDASSDRPRLGSGTNNEYGQAQWTLTGIETLGQEEMGKWLAGGAAGPLWDAALPLNRTFLPTVTLRSRRLLRVGLELDFTGWFLVRDPATSKSKDAEASADGEKQPDAFPLLTADHRVLLRQRGFRGPFRSQVERIARTLFADAGGDPNRAAAPGQSRIVEALFGDTGGRAVVRCTAFRDQRPAWNGYQAQQEHGAAKAPLPEDIVERRQTALLPHEFVAIDRFTGGAAEHLKFDCVAAWRPLLCGSLSLDLDRLSRRCGNEKTKIPPAAAFGLLLLALRDLCDGDVSFGFGWGKGFGECRGAIAEIQLPEPAVIAAEWDLAGAWPAALARENQRTVNGPFARLTGEQRALAALCAGRARTYLRGLDQQVKS